MPSLLFLGRAGARRGAEAWPPRWGARLMTWLSRVALHIAMPSGSRMQLHNMWGNIVWRECNVNVLIRMPTDESHLGVLSAT